MGRHTETESSSNEDKDTNYRRKKHKRNRIPSDDNNKRDKNHKSSKNNNDQPMANEKPIESPANLLLSTTGGAYIPPAKLRAMQAKITDKSSEAYQRIAWEALKKSIHGLINRVNVSNISDIVKKLLMENVIRGRGLFARSILLAQTSSPTFTHVFAALVAIINTRLPQIGDLILKRLIFDFRKAFRRNEKERCLADANFIAHLVNQKVAHEILALELLTLLLEQTTNDSIEVAVLVLKECGLYLSKVAPRPTHLLFEHLRRINSENQCDTRVSYMIEVMFQIRRDGWRDHTTIIEELDLIEEDDQITHTASLLLDIDPEDRLNVFKFDPDYEANEAKYAEIRENFLEEESDSDADDNEQSGSSANESDDEDERAAAGAQKQDEKQEIIDHTEANLVYLRRTIYLMIQSSLSADEGAHRLLQLKIKPGDEYEVASMVLDCCAQTRSYESRYGQLAQRLCAVKVYQKPEEDIKKKAIALGKPSQEPQKLDLSGPCISYVEQFERIFVEQYTTVHRLETPKLKNIAMFYAHLLFTDSISWAVLQCIKLNERDTTSSGRIFIKHLLLEMSSFFGMARLLERFRDTTIQPYLAGLMPKNNPKDTRFAINYLVVIGLGGLTIDLREFLDQVKSGEILLPKEEIKEETSEEEESSSSSDSSSSDSSSSDSSSDSDSDSSSSSEEESPEKNLKVKKEPTIGIKKEESSPLTESDRNYKRSYEQKINHNKRSASPSRRVYKESPNRSFRRSRRSLSRSITPVKRNELNRISRREKSISTPSPSKKQSKASVSRSSKLSKRSVSSSVSPPRQKRNDSKSRRSLSNSLSPPRPRTKNNLPTRGHHSRKSFSRSMTPPRRKLRRPRSNSVSPPRRRTRNNLPIRDSHPRKSSSHSISPTRRKVRRSRSNSVSPPRRRTRNNSPIRDNRPRKSSSHSISPTRRKVRRSRSNSVSPPRRRTKNNSPIRGHHQRKSSRSMTPPRSIVRRSRSNSVSLPRRRVKNNSPIRGHHQRKSSRSMTPSRKNPRNSSSSSVSPPRSQKKRSLSPQRKISRDSSISPPRGQKRPDIRKETKYRNSQSSSPSPPRRRQKSPANNHTAKKNSISLPRRGHDELSPRRKKDHDLKAGTKRNKVRVGNSASSSASPPRKNRL